MLFNSSSYLAFLLLVFLMYLPIRRWCGRIVCTIFLVAASLVFYGWMAPRMVLFLLAMMAINWALSRSLARARDVGRERGTRGRGLLAVAVTVNLLPLVFYKYTTFLFPPLAGVLKIAAPLGVSYFTFVQISFLVDTFRGKDVRRETGDASHGIEGLLDYALASVFWPKMVAGPIIRPVAFVRQWRVRFNDRIRLHRIYLGLVIFILGMAKKVVFADPLAGIADWGWAQPAGGLETGAAWLTTVAYTLQLYFDFSGYSDMAWGSALLFNIRLPWNFYSPYKAASIQDFWRRWHISLSLWLRDYLYFTFGGSRCSLPKTIRNVFFTFLLGGIWHGAGWTFVSWGALHGAALSLNNLWRKLQPRRLPKLVGWVLTLLFVHLAWVFFRAPDLNSALCMIGGLIGSHTSGNLVGYDWVQNARILTYPFLALSVLWLFLPNTVQLTRWMVRRLNSRKALAAMGALCGLAIVLSLVCGFCESMPKTPFVYFKF